MLKEFISNRYFISNEKFSIQIFAFIFHRDKIRPREISRQSKFIDIIG